MVDYDNDQKHKEVDNVVLKANGVNQNEINDKEHEIGWSEREVRAGTNGNDDKSCG